MSKGRNKQITNKQKSRNISSSRNVTMDIVKRNEISMPNKQMNLQLPEVLCITARNETLECPAIDE